MRAMKADIRAWAVAITICTLPAIGCQFSAQASGEAKAGGESSAQAEASVETTEPKAEAKAEAPAGPIRYEQGKLDYEGVINFEYNRAEIRTDAETEKTLGDFKAFLDKHSEVKISVEGHTDSRGSDDYNRKLSDRRAAAVRKWLVDKGVADSRVTSVGKGEDAPQEAEPEECNDKEPQDTAPCEGVWAKNRRVVFQVTAGAETIPQPEPKPEPEPAPKPVEQPVAAPAEKPCRWLWGPRLGALGPNSWVNANVATQPCLDWLELSLGIGLGFGDVQGESADADVDDSYWSLTIPLRARFWPFRVHSVIGDLGIGMTHYWISADAEDAAGNSYSYDRDSTSLIAHAGIGYGFRPNGPEPGLRLGILIGALVHLTKLSDPEVSSDAGFPAASRDELTDSLNDDTDDLDDLEPYAELSIGWMF
jgi:outer membrane protein OmpA-like peptidoglycan-associated protein